MTDREAKIARLLEQAASADRDAAGEFPGSYYRKAHRARARRLRARAAKLMEAR
jgi:hypothetical protein